jgi:glycosyltransferase involved in cell wall biosynthesis
MKNLNLNCPIGNTGYGITSFNIYKQLIEQNINVSLFPMGGIAVDTIEERDLILSSMQNQESFDKNSPCLKIWHQFDLALRIGSGPYSALTFFEVDRLKPIEINMINNTDNIFVASKWAKNILLANNITTNITVSPLAADLSIFNKDIETPGKDKDKTENGKYIFINIGKWEVRKGHDLLVEMFNAAFTEEDNVELWMINHNPFLSEEDNQKWIGMYKNSPLGDKIKIFPRINTHKELAQVVALSDCGIFPARAEGWNNEIIEVMAMDKPVILTNYSAHTEYATKENSYLIDIDELIPAKDNKFFDGFGNWANLGDNQFEQTVEYMKYVYTNKVRTNENGLKTAQSYTWDKTANIISNTIFGK